MLRYGAGQVRSVTHEVLPYGLTSYHLSFNATHEVVHHGAGQLRSATHEVLRQELET